MRETLTTITDLAILLDWPDIRDEPLKQYGMRRYRVMPSNPKFASIDFLFDDRVTFLQQIGCCEWHSHPDMDNALQLGLDLVQQRTCILEERTKSGRYSGSGPVGAKELCNTLSLTTEYLVRRYFNREPLREEIDFSRYVRGKHLYIERAHKEKSDAVWRSLGRPPPDF